jgi:phosphatidylinositol alpha 1,6-mannosyltransferase
MASGRPVVFAADGEGADIVRRHRAGIVVAPGDTAGLAGAVRALKDDPRLRAELGANGRRAAEEHFDRTVIGTRFAEYLERHLER